MDNQLQNISKIFTDRLYRIPDYQRGYAWTEKQLRDFWNDIVQLESDKNHYVGVLTLERVEKCVTDKWNEDKWIIDSKNFEPYYVVDGQQRLTTTIILIQALTESVPSKTLLNYSKISEIRKRYIYDSKNNGISRSYIFGYEKDNPSYEFLKQKIYNEYSASGYPKELTIYTHNLEYAKVFFTEKLSQLTLQQKEIVFRKVTQQLLFNIYTISTDIDVFIAFETMNNRGKPLSNLELLKNRLIYLSTKFDADESDKKALRRVINEGWKSVYHFLGKNKERPLNDDDFLNNHCLVYFGSKLVDETLESKRFKLKFKYQEGFEEYLLDEKFTYKNILTKTKGKYNLTISDVNDYVQSLQKSVEIWYTIHNPTLNSELDDYEKVALDRLYRINIRSNYVLLALYLRNTNTKQRLQFLDSYEKYLFVLLIVRIHISKFNKFDIYPITLSYFLGKTAFPKFIESLCNSRKEIIESKDFLEAIVDVFRSGFYQWRAIKYLLFEYEKSIQSKSKSKKDKINWSEYSQEINDYDSVEHIYPQNPKAECWQFDYSNYNAKERKALSNSLGNLLALSKQKNSSLQNDCFVKKIEKSESYVGYRYGSYSENEVAKQNSWTPDDIYTRGLKLLNFIEQRWELDLGNDNDRARILNLGFMHKD